MPGTYLPLEIEYMRFYIQGVPKTIENDLLLEFQCLALN